MKLSLRQARRLEREIGAELDLATNGSRSSGVDTLQVSVYEDIESKLKSIALKAKDGLERYKNLVGIRFDIRKKIETVNEISGINVLMNQEAQLKAMQKMLVTLLGNELTDEEKSIAISRHAALKNQIEAGNPPQSRYGEATDAITLSAALSTEFMTKLQQEAKDVQRQLLHVVESLAVLNASSTIELSDEDVKALEVESIVV